MPSPEATVPLRGPKAYMTLDEFVGVTQTSPGLACTLWVIVLHSPPEMSFVPVSSYTETHASPLRSPVPSHRRGSCWAATLPVTPWN